MRLILLLVFILIQSIQSIEFNPLLEIVPGQLGNAQKIDKLFQIVNEHSEKLEKLNECSEQIKAHENELREKDVIINKMA